MPLTIAIDGPAGAGKSTIADALAGRLGGIFHLDTGAMYRAVGLYCIRSGIAFDDTAAIEEALPKIHVDARYAEGTQQTLLNGEDVSRAIREPQVSAAASAVAKLAAVRKAMVAAQQKLAKGTSVIVDGRDICLRVLPNATVKIYLTASAEERAMRRWQDEKVKNPGSTYEDVLADLIRRDHQDMNREVDPLRPTEDATIVDTTGMSFDEVVDQLCAIVKEALQHE